MDRKKTVTREELMLTVILTLTAFALVVFR